MNYFLFAIFSISSFASISSQLDFGHCPQKPTKELTGLLIENFKRNKDLREIKKTIINQNIKEKYFITKYDIDYDSLNKSLNFKYDCPEIIGSIVHYKKNGKKKFYTVLAKDGKTYDPNFEVMLRAEKMISDKLPTISFEKTEMTKDSLAKVSDYLNYLRSINGIDYNEIIINKNQELIGILSRNNITTSVFMGRFNWKDKTKRLRKSLNYFLDKKKQPVLVKFVDDKKMVVKFSHPL